MTIGLFDDNSIIVTQQILPKELLQPALLIAKVKGFKNLDEYVIDLVMDDLISVKEGGQNFEELGESIAKYLSKIERLEKLYPSSTDPNVDSKKDYVKIKLDSDLVHRFNKLQERKQQQIEEESESTEENEEKEKEKEDLK